VELLRLDEGQVRRQSERLAQLRSTRDGEAVTRALSDVEETARGDGNLLHPMREALKRRATLGEVSDALRRVFGEYHPTR
jgi:methylmalonyl-CoA mutase N-terminal domain/subunit